jgi:hypothetical protein
VDRSVFVWGRRVTKALEQSPDDVVLEGSMGVKMQCSNHHRDPSEHSTFAVNKTNTKQRNTLTAAGASESSHGQEEGK